MTSKRYLDRQRTLRTKGIVFSFQCFIVYPSTMNKITPRKTTTLTVDSESEFFPIFSRLNLRLFELSKINNELHLSIKKCLKYPLFSIERFFFWSKDHTSIYGFCQFFPDATREWRQIHCTSILHSSQFFEEILKSNVKCKSPVSVVLQ